MATWDDVARTCLALPGTGEGLSRGWRQWKVRDRSFVWEHPLGKKDVAELGAAEAWACRAPRRLLAEHPIAP